MLFCSVFIRNSVQSCGIRTPLTPPRQLFRATERPQVDSFELQSCENAENERRNSS